MARGSANRSAMFGAMILAFGCTPPTLQPPVLDRVEPSFGYNGESHTVEIIGQGFYPEVAIDAWQGEADVDRAYNAWLTGPEGGVELEYELLAVGIVDDTHLVATIDQGLPAGRYDLAVASPAGARAALGEAFTVTDSQAAGLSLTAEKVAYPITEVATLTIELVDLGGERVAIPFEVAVVATASDGSEVAYSPGTLSGAVPTPDGDGLRGTLVDGVATVTVGVEHPVLATVRVSPWDAGSPVVDDSLALQFVPGDDLRVDLRLPVPSEPEPSFEAGVPFYVEAELVDQYGNPVGFPTAVDLETACSGWYARGVQLDGPTLVEVTPVTVTDDLCPHDKVVVSEGGGPTGASALFTVDPGPADHFVVIAFATPSPHAGEALGIYVAPEDQFGNLTVWTSALNLTASAGGLLDTSCEPQEGLLEGAFGCVGTVTVAGAGQTVSVFGDGGITGVSNTFTVLADEVPVSVEGVAPAQVVAGEAFTVTTIARDAWGNAIDPAVLGDDLFSLTDDLGEVDCVADGATAASEALFTCTLYTARAGALLTTELLGYGMTASAAIDVINGELAVVEVSAPASAVAGALASFDLAGLDAYGNPYAVQTDPVLDVSDDSGTFSATATVLAPDGTGSVVGFFTRSGVTAVRVSQAGVALGASPALVVLAAGTTGLALTPAGPWAWVNEPLDVVVEGVDVFGNRTELSGTATLTSTSTGSPSVDATLVNGVGVGSFTWTSNAFVDGLHAQVDAYEGQVDLVVASRCAGPTVDVTFGGYDEAVACTDAATGEALVVADLSGSGGLRGLVGYAIADLDDAVVTDTQPVLELPIDGVGRHDLLALAVDGAGCGAEVGATAWAGPDDGTPVGPIALSTVVVLPDVDEVWDVDVDDVVDCSRDPAAGQGVELRTTLGSLAGTPTGEGLEVVLDGNGDAVVPLTMSAPVSGGTIEVHATVDGGAASGLLLVAVGDADSTHPTVTDQDPAGIVSGLVDEVRLTFSEPLLASSVVATRFLVTGPEITTVTPVLSDGDTVVTLALSPPVNADLGGYAVEVSLDVRDVHGNRLSGDWTGLVTSYLGGFGAAGTVPVPVTCGVTDPPGLTFRPDGDPGLGLEADKVTIEVSSAAAPAWWVLEVHDAADALVFQGWTVPLGPIDAVAWDARNFAGYVVPNGVYRVQVWPDDGIGNRGLGCEVSVTVDNPMGGAP